ncbi:Fe(3+) dicitrate transport protein [Shewanella chilikensis]|uniref:Fe(3+) dicitrate transport protein n=1 Tax=Shewanella chilikensis TaxID=558541 RepID=A0ABX5PN52_9GAMM|nr:TonB-dependent receptor [Shewanella chilikensis]MCL1154733.1 TonB-dependent receptor [Shewanella chilikensis]PYE58222.1 Fe(3+) dicitrate transport protein [Shewanella chilikensis]GGZ30076.1 TonB-dependent receptor [Shewanella chilikensis]
MSQRRGLLKVSAVAGLVSGSLAGQWAHASESLVADHPAFETAAINAMYYDSAERQLTAGGELIPTLPGSFSIRGAGGSGHSGIAIIEDRVNLAPAPYSAPYLWQLPDPDTLVASSANAAGSLLYGGSGSFGVLETQSLGLHDTPGNSLRLQGNEDKGWGAEGRGLIDADDYKVLLQASHRRQQPWQEPRSAELGQDDSQTKVLFKIAANSLPGARSRQHTEFKYQYSQQRQFLPGMGLTPADWQLNPELLYGAATQDRLKSRSHRYQLSHRVEPTAGSRVFTELYYHSHHSSQLQMSFADGAFIQGDALEQLAALDAAAIGAVSLVDFRRDDDFEAMGIQTQAITQYGRHKVSYSARWHRDKAELAPGLGSWLWQGGRLSDTAQSLSIRIDDKASVWSSAVTAELNWSAVTLELGVGYEDVSLERSSETVPLSAADFSESEWLPTAKLSWRGEALSLFISVGRAWAAASPGNQGQRSQQAWQYELGGRFESGRLKSALSLYQRDFDNLHFDCTANSFCDPALRLNQYNLGEVDVKGVELALDYRLDSGSVNWPMGLKYHYTQAKALHSGCLMLSGPCLMADEQLPWLPEHALSLHVGLEWDGFKAKAQGIYRSEVASLSPQETAKDSMQLDLLLSYDFNSKHQLYFRAEDLLDDASPLREDDSGLLASVGRRLQLGYRMKF